MTTIKEFFGLKAVKLSGYSKSVACVNPGLAIGIEVETENCRLGLGDYMELLHKYHWTPTTDNSLRNNGIEFISSPMASGVALASLADFFAATQFTDEANYTDRCSVHVHANCQDLTMEQVVALSLVYSVVEDILFKFVGHYRDTNLYCMPWTSCRYNHDFVSRFLSNPSSTAKYWQKYTALNIIPLQTYGTVEFRHMHGTSDITKLTTWINVIGSMFNFITKNSLEDVIKEISTLNSTSEYERFFDRVFSGLLQYDDTYRELLENGVILCKYALLNYKVGVKPALNKDNSADYLGIDARQELIFTTPPEPPRGLVNSYVVDWETLQGVRVAQEAATRNRTRRTSPLDRGVAEDQFNALAAIRQEDAVRARMRETRLRDEADINALRPATTR